MNFVGRSPKGAACGLTPSGDEPEMDPDRDIWRDANLLTRDMVPRGWWQPEPTRRSNAAITTDNSSGFGSDGRLSELQAVPVGKPN